MRASVIVRDVAAELIGGCSSKHGNRGPFGGLFGLTNVWATPKPNQTVIINAEKVPNPLKADEMKDFEESRKTASAWGKFDPDPEAPNTCDSFESREFWFKLVAKADWTCGHDRYFEYGTVDKVPKPGALDWSTVVEEVSKADAKRIEWGKNYRGS